MSRGSQDGNQWGYKMEDRTGKGQDWTGEQVRWWGHAAPCELAEDLPLKGPQLQGAVARCG